MKELVLPGGVSRYRIRESGEYLLRVREDSEAIVRYAGERDLQVRWKIEAERGTSASVLFINDLEGDLDAQLDAGVQEGASFRLGYLEVSDGSARCRARIRLQGEGAYSDFHTATLCHEPLDYDIETVHEAESTSGYMENYGLVMNDSEWRIVCAGRIRKGMAKSVSRQATRVLTFAQPRQVKILPILYIDENDVEASHATSLGQPDEQMLYYMESRGLGKKEAVKLLTIGYIMPIARIFRDGSLQKKTAEEITKKVTLWNA